MSDIVPLESPEVSGRPRRRPSTETSRFGSSRREGHDASEFYARFSAPTVSSAEELGTAVEVDRIHQMDARRLAEVIAPDSVALVVTSPPYFAGKEYETALGEGGIPATYFEYLQLLREVFAACREVLEPGGRIAVNVANLGRRPYRSLSADVTAILQDDLGMLLRGEVIWWKGRSAGGSCAWGSFQSPSNPVLRDVTERVIVASKGRFDRALSAQQRSAAGRPSIATISRDEFMEATTDLWEIPPERATRVGHPAPFPVELPQRLIEMNTYRGDVVLDPFMGAGSTAVAAVRTGRSFVGCETDSGYVATAEARVNEERARVVFGSDGAAVPYVVERPAGAGRHGGPGVGELERAIRQGRTATEVAAVVLADCGFVGIRADVKFSDIGVEVSFAADDAAGHPWRFEVSGSFTITRSGLCQVDSLWKAIGKAAVLYQRDPEVPLVLLTTELPVPKSAGAKSLARVCGAGRPVHDAMRLLERDGYDRLRRYAGGEGGGA